MLFVGFVKIFTAMMNAYSISLLVYIQENLTLRRGGVGSFKTMRAFVPFSVIPVAVSLQKPSFLCFLLVSHQGSKYAIVDSTGLSLWSLECGKFVAHGREGLRRQTRRFGCALSTAADPGGRSRPLCSSWP